MVHFLIKATGYTFGALSALVITQYVARKKGYTEPAVYLNNFYLSCKRFWLAVGSRIAWMSSFLTLIDIDIQGLIDACRDVTLPMGKILLSGFWTVNGYYQYCKSYIEKRRWLVVTGSIVLSTMILGGGWYAWSMYRAGSMQMLREIPSNITNALRSLQVKNEL